MAQVSGKVSQIFVQDRYAIFKLEGLPDGSKPLRDNFEIRQSDQNYNALYSLALSAAINRYTLSVSTTEAITSTKNATVKELWVNW